MWLTKLTKKGDDKEDTQKVYNCNQNDAKEMKRISEDVEGKVEEDGKEKEMEDVEEVFSFDKANKEMMMLTMWSNVNEVDEENNVGVSDARVCG